MTISQNDRRDKERLTVAIAEALAKLSPSGTPAKAIDPKTARPVRYAIELSDADFLLACRHRSWRQTQ